jgi:hypothetical protein
MTELFNSYNKYNDLLIQLGGAPNKYSSPFKIWIDKSTNTDLTGSLYFQVEIDTLSEIGNEIHYRRVNSKPDINTLLAPITFDNTITLHVTILEIYFDITSELGKTITDCMIDKNKKIKISNIVETAFNRYLKNKRLYSPQGSYEKLGNFFTRTYEAPQNEYSNFKKYIYSELFNLINYDIKTKNLNLYIYNALNIKTNKELNFNIYYSPNNNNINYAISDYFYKNGWKPHLSILRFNDDIDQNKFTGVLNKFKKNKHNKDLRYINLSSYNSTNNTKGSLSKIKVTLNHPSYVMYLHNIEINI